MRSGFATTPAQRSGRAISRAEVLEANAAWLPSLLASIKPGPHDDALKKASMADVAVGRMSGPFTLEELPPNCVFSRRFPVIQPDKMVDDLLRSGVNSGARILTPVQLASVDVSLASAVTFAAAFPGVPLHLWKRDHEGAFRQFPVRLEDRVLLAVAIWDPDAGAVRFFLHHVLPFGAIASVFFYNLLADSLVFLAREMFRIPLFSFLLRLLLGGACCDCCRGFRDFWRAKFPARMRHQVTEGPSSFSYRADPRPSPAPGRSPV